MSEAITQQVNEFSRAVRMLAVVGAALKLRSAEHVDPALDAHIRDGLRLATGSTELDLDLDLDLDDRERTALLTTIEMALAESSELFKNPGRTAAWQVADGQLLQAMGRASSHAFDRILGLAGTRPSLRAALDGVFLDVGTGVGGIALRAVETCAALRVDAIDIWEPALALAAENVAASPDGARIQLRQLDVSALPAGARYTLAWLPTMFLKRAVVEQAIARIAAASQPGAWLVAPLYSKPDDPFMAVMASLRTLRSGGELTEAADLVALLRAGGYVDIEVDPAPVASFVMGRLA